jgi:hypothetical protein
MYVQDLHKQYISRNMRYDIVSTYDTLIFSFFINWLPRQHFCGPSLHDTSYDTSTMASLIEIVSYTSINLHRDLKNNKYNKNMILLHDTTHYKDSIIH